MEISRSTVLVFVLGNLALFALLLVVGLLLGRWVVHRVRQRAAERHEAEVAVLASNLVHEARNMLNAMRGHLALVRRRIDRDVNKAKSHLDAIDREINELNGLFEAFLTFARPLDNDPQVLDPVRIVDEVLDYVGLDLAQANITVVRDYAQSVPAVRADAGRLRRAILNLVVNARQAMGAGGTLTVRIRGQGRKVVIEVEDTGPGIAPDQREEIFKPFFTTKPGGSGLGLAIVRRTIEELGGKVEVESELGRGTVFRITLPAVRHVRSRGLRDGPTGAARREAERA